MSSNNWGMLANEMEQQQILAKWDFAKPCAALETVNYRGIPYFEDVVGSGIEISGQCLKTMLSKADRCRVINYGRSEHSDEILYGILLQFDEVGGAELRWYVCHEEIQEINGSTGPEDLEKTDFGKLLRMLGNGQNKELNLHCGRPVDDEKEWLTIRVGTTEFSFDLQGRSTGVSESAWFKHALGLRPRDRIVPTTSRNVEGKK